MLISIHQNSLPEFPDTRGAQVFYGAVEGSEVLAEGMQDVLNQTINVRAKTCRSMGDGVYLLEHAQCPAILVECGFLSNEDELQQLKEESYQTKLAVILLSAAMDITDQPLE